MAPQVQLTEDESQWLERSRNWLRESEEYLRPYFQECNDGYRQYRAVKDAKSRWKANPRDRDQAASELADQFDRDISIPIAYSTIETEVPRTIASLPRGQVLPIERLADESVGNMQLLIEQQQSLFGYTMLSQEVVKSAYLYGLGVKKGPYWKRVIQPGMPYLRRATDATVSGSPWVEARKDRVVIDDAWGEHADIFDCRWDRFGYDRHTLRWFGHRSWRDNEYIADQLGLTPGQELPDRSAAVWNSAAAQQLTSEHVEDTARGKSQMEDGIYKDRLSTAGHGDSVIREGLHEVWEIWTARGDVVTILDNAYPVLIRKNPFWHGQIPFHFFRPQTQGFNALHGISEIEPLADLIRELNLIRNLRSKNALLALMRVLVFDEDAVDRDDLVFGPGTAIPVRSDDPRAHLYALEIPDIPYASAQIEEQIKGDLDRTSGIGDTVAGASTGGGTATEANIIQTATGIRIQGKTERYEGEAAVPFTNQMISLNQQMVIQKDIRVPKEPEPGEIDPKPWQWLTLTPQELAGQMAYQIDRNSMGPRNPQMEAQQAQELWQSLQGHPMVDQQRLLKHYLEGKGVRQPSSWVLPQPMTPAAFMQAVAKDQGEEYVQRVMALIGGQDGG